jgi:uncharacterized protein (DUF111 family)
MKKGRPGHWLVIVAELTDSQRLAELVLASTTSLGVRIREDRRVELERFQAIANTSFGDIRLKVARLADGGLRAQPEFESVREAAVRTGKTPLEIHAAALVAWNRGRGSS